MNRLFKLMTMLFALVILPLLTSAQNKIIIEDEEPDAVFSFSRNKAGDEIIRIMHSTKPPYFREPDVPRFLLTDTKGRFALGIGGYVQAVAEYDFGGIVKNVDFLPSSIPAPGTTAVKNQFQMDISTSTLFLKMVGRTKKLGDFILYTAGNFRGDNYGFQLLHAYIQFLGFKAGYSYGNFMDMAAVPSTIDFAGPCGVAFYRSVQFAYTYSKLKNWEFTGAIELPVVDGTYGSYSVLENASESAAQRMPDFTANVQYNWGPNSQIRAAAIVRSMTYDSFNSIGQISAKSEIGWGVQLSSVFMMGQKLQFFGQANYGKGISQYMNDLSCLDVDLVPDPDDPSKMQALPMMGWMAGLQYDFSSSVFASTTYSATRLYSANGWPVQNSDFYRYGQYFACNVFWNVTKDLQVGAEYLRGWRTGFLDNSTRHANRINAMVQYSF